MLKYTVSAMPAEAAGHMSQKRPYRCLFSQADVGGLYVYTYWGIYIPSVFIDAFCVGSLPNRRQICDRGLINLLAALNQNNVTSLGKATDRSIFASPKLIGNSQRIRAVKETVLILFEFGISICNCSGQFINKFDKCGDLPKVCPFV